MALAAGAIPRRSRLRLSTSEKAMREHWAAEQDNPVLHNCRIGRVVAVSMLAEININVPASITLYGRR